ncbi:MAG: TM0996/MTH895 family glutaredoxin-like protein [Bacteroidales bacterium]|nr:TM0996/MTH895 family glutaredoxin-like protein [Bacteroidales bacterium]
MNIIVLGTGCAKCKTLEQLTRKVVADLNINAVVTKEEDITKIISYGIPRTPGIVVDGHIVVSGRVPSESELKQILTKL